jgi:tRNA threonylcarbamoyladenosine biosynthesis protein TsaB
VTTFALDTATPDPALALLDGPDVLAEAWLGRAPGGGRRILEAAHHVFAMAGVAPADLHEVVVGTGPGGFTGLRIGIATAQGLGQALGIPVHGASTLEAIALGLGVAAEPGALVAPVIDARRKQVFAAAYVVGDGGDLRVVISPAAWHPGDLADALSREGAALMGGDGAHLVPARRGTRVVAGHVLGRVAPSLLVARVRAAGPRPAVPEYLRLPDAEENRLRRAREAAPGATA